MKIAIVGTHGIGKSTLVHDIFTTIKERNPEFKIVEVVEQAREWNERYGFGWRSSNPWHYAEYELSLFHYFNFAFFLDANIIADRSPIDVLAYSSIICPQEIVEEMEDKFTNYLNFYKNTVLFYNYIGKPNDVLAEKVQKKVEEYLTRYGIPFQSFTRVEYAPIKEVIINLFQP